MFPANEGRRPEITVGIIAVRRRPQLEETIRHVLAQLSGRGSEIVVAVETPGVAEPTESSADAQGVRWLDIPVGRGLAYNRNRVLEVVRGEILVFLDDDCFPQPGWLEDLLAPLEDRSVDAVMGGVDIPASTVLGDSISALGFPAGGSAGFETMFHVGPDGLTNNISTLNCAIRKSVLDEVGGFDESLTFGGEDTELAYRMVKAGKRILYNPEARVTHPPRAGMGEFFRWFFRRGRAKYQFSRKVPELGVFVRHRMASHAKIVWSRRLDPKVALIVPLIGLSMLVQQVGFLTEYWKER